jgi:mitochondrial fission protein ELM1
MITEISEYKGSPVFVIKRDNEEKYPFSFGLAKAKMILETIDAIKLFVDECESKKIK